MKTDELPPRDETGKFTAGGAFPADERSPETQDADNTAQRDESDRKKAAEPAPEKAAPKDDTKPKSKDLSGVTQLVERFLGTSLDEPKKKKDATKGNEKPGDEPPPEEDKEKETKPAPKAKPVPKAAPKIAPSAEDEDTRIARVAAKVVGEFNKTSPKADKGAAPANEPEVPEAEVERVATLERMEKLYPAKYKGLAAKYKTSMTKLVDYSKQWQKDNPGQEFDENAPVHEAFYAENDVDWNDDDYVKAMADTIADSKIQSATAETNKRLSTIEKEDKLRKAQPTIYREQGRAAASYWKKLGKDYEGLIKSDGELDLAVAQKLSKKDPDALSEAVAEAQRLDSEVHELYGIMNGLIDYNDKNPIHADLANFASEREKMLLAKPEEERRDKQGRDFVSAEDYYKITDKAKREQSVWTFTATDLAALRASAKAKERAEKMAAEEKRLEKMATARGWRKPDPAEKPNEEEETPAAEEDEETPAHAAADNDKPDVPGAGSSSKMAAGKASGKGGTVNPLDAFGDRFLNPR